MYNKNYISVGIDVGSAFSFMTIVAPDGSVIQKPFKITHNKTDSLERAVSAIKKAEELYSLESRIFLESNGIYHFPLFCYLPKIMLITLYKNATSIFQIPHIHLYKFAVFIF